MPKSLQFFSLITLILVFSAVGFAQSQAGSGQIAGQVADTNGAAVPNATVKVTNKGTGLERTATSSGDGLFNIVLLPPGTYTVVAEASGFAPATLDEVVVNVGRSADVTLTVGARGVQATVLVTAEAIQVTRN
jgi:hypothetical protein